MDDTRIRQLTEEVLGQLRRGGSPEARSLESRVAALETAVARLAQGAAAPAAKTLTLVATPASSCDDVTSPPGSHPALQLLRVGGSTTGQCILEPDKPCNHSGACRTLGY